MNKSESAADWMIRLWQPTIGGRVWCVLLDSEPPITAWTNDGARSLG